MLFATHAHFRIVPILLAVAFTANAEPEMDAVPEEGATESATMPEPAVESNAVDEATAIELSLRSAVNLAIENNLGVEVARHAPLIAEEDIDIAWSAYDPLFTADLVYSKSKSQSGVSPFNTDLESTAGKLGVNGLIPLIGAHLSVEYSGSDEEGSDFERLKPKQKSGLALTASVPLLKGLVWTQIEVASTLHASSLQDFRRVIMDTIRDTVSAYWTLVAEEEQLRVANKSLNTSRALLEQTRTQYEVGVKAKVEVIQAEAGVASRELDVIRADAAYQNSQDNLIDAVWGVRLTPDTSMQVRPTDNLLDFVEYDVDRKLATDLAIENRPEVESLELDIHRRETLVVFHKNQRLPQFDLNLTYGTSGVEGKGNPDFFAVTALPLPDTGGRYGDTHDRWFSRNGNREYSVGGLFTIPLGNSSGRHNVSKARLELRRSKTELIQLHQKIILEIRRDIRLLKAARKGIDASERQRVAAEEQLRAERIRLEHGESTPFEVLQKESELVEAEVAKINALQLYRTSASDLDRAQGTILRTHNIVVGSIAGLRNGFEKESFSFNQLLEPILP